MTSDYFDLSAMYGSAVELAFAVGMMVSSLLFSSVLKIKRKIRTSFIGLFGMGIMSAVCGLVPPVMIGWAAFALCCVGLGASGNVHTIPLTAYIQETAAPEKMGRAVFCSDTDFIGDHAGGTVIQQSDRREGRRGPLVLHFGSGNRDHHDSYFVPVSHEIQKEKILIHCAAAFLLI